MGILARSAAGLLRRECQPDGTEVRYEYNRRGQLIEQHHSDGRVVQWQWDKDGQLLGEKDGERLTRYRYDRLGPHHVTVVVHYSGLPSKNREVD